jgi:PAS domain S-box-containing protein
LKTSTKQNEFVALWVAFVILGTVALLAYKSIAAAGDTLGWTEHARKVLHQIEEVSSAYSRSISERRAHLLTGDRSQLDDVADFDARAAVAVDGLRRLVEDSPAQLKRLDEWVQLNGARIAALDASSRGSLAEDARTGSAESLALAAHIRTLREAMEADEEQLLAARDARTRSDIANTKRAEIAGTLVSFAMLLVAFRRLQQEIASRQRSEMALHASERFLESIVENIPDMIFVKEAGELRFERINRAGEGLLGVKREDLVGKNDFDLFPADQAEFFQARDRETLANRIVVEIAEEPIRTRNGERWLHTKKVPVTDGLGTPKYLLGISEDVTERRKDAAALRAAKEAAEAANQELEAFSYSVAHDLRAPLRAIDGFSRAIEEDCADKLDALGLEHLGRVRRSALHMGELIDGLLGLSRLTRGEIVRENVDLTQVARRSGARLREAHPQRQVDLVVEEGLLVDADMRLLTAAVDNLLGNAWKFTSKRADARIEFGRRLSAGRPVYFVRDNGAGFDPSYVHKLFGAFQRLHATSEFDGSGIGLATVQRIVRRHGGRVWAEGEVGRGATFHFTLASTAAEESE